MNDQPAFSESIRARLAREPYLEPRAIIAEDGSRLYPVRKTGQKHARLTEPEMEAFLNEILQP